MQNFDQEMYSKQYKKLAENIFKTLSDKDVSLPSICLIANYLILLSLSWEPKENAFRILNIYHTNLKKLLDIYFKE